MEGPSMENMQSDLISMEEEKRQLHVMMAPWLSKSHIRAFLELANKICAHGIKISIFLSTPLNIRWIRQLQPLPHIDLLELPLPSIDGQPQGVESTADLERGGSFDLLMKAMDELEKPLKALLGSVSPDFLINDMTLYWASPIAAKLGIPAIFFVITSASSSAFLVGHQAMVEEKSVTLPDLMVPPPGFPSAHIRHSSFGARRHVDIFQKKEGLLNMAARWSMCFKGSWAIAVNSCVELEGKYLEYIERATGRPVLPVGIQMPDPTPPRPADDRCLAWLDFQLPRSVVVVSFGSECTLTQQELAALALGVEESELPFLFILLHQMADELPRGFRERTQERGVVVME